MTNTGKNLHQKKPKKESLASEDVFEDPLKDLFQIDNVQGTPLEKEVLALVTRLLQNVEEYYELQGQIMEVMTVDRTQQERFKSLLDSLIRGLSTEQEFLGRNFKNFVL